eukprot:tig00020996_g16930.t1
MAAALVGAALLGAVLVYGVLYAWRFSRVARAMRGWAAAVPCPQNRRFWGNVKALDRVCPLLSFRRLAEEAGPTWLLKILFLDVRVVTSDPRAVRALLECPKAAKAYRPLRAMVGLGVVTANGPRWKRSRKLLSPAFGSLKLDAQLPAVWDSVRRLSAILEAAARSGAPVDVDALATRLTLDAVTRALFSVDTDCQRASFSSDAVSCFLRAASEVSARTFEPWRALVPGGKRRAQFEADLGASRRWLLDVVRGRREAGEAGGRAGAPRDALDCLLASRVNCGCGGPCAGLCRPLTDDEAVDECLTLLFAGHDSTAHALAWTLHLLAEHPEEGRPVAEEGAAFLGALEACPPPELPARLRSAAGALPRATRAVKEALRLYPVAPGSVRTTDDATEVGGYRLPAGVDVILDFYSMHRSPKLWDRPDDFVPGRWTREDVPEGYAPFSLGPRSCIGQHFAMLELRLAVAAVAGRFTLSPAPGAPPVRPRSRLTIAPEGFLATVALREA